jgi:predicted dehydrogenase
MPDLIRWGVIGSGGIARRRTIPEGIVRASNARLAAVYDVNEEVNRAVAAEHGAAAVGSLPELLDAGVDAVYIATPANLHYEEAFQAASAGKHILCEKPLGMSVDEAERMTAVAAEMGVRFGTAFMMRFHSQHQAAKTIIEAGGIGKPVFGRAQLSCWYPPIENAWRQDPTLGGGGSLIDMGGHCIDLLEMFFGPVRKVSCFTANLVHDYRSEDSAVALLQFASGALATVDTFFCIQDEGSRNVLELHGSAGSILAEGTIGQGSHGKMVAVMTRDAGGYKAEQTRSSTNGTPIDPLPVNPYCAEIEEFSRAILECREPSIGGREGIRSQQILTACYESAKTGRAIEI